MKLASAMEKDKLKQARILIVDDQEANIELLKRMLEHDGYTAVESTMDSANVVPMCAQQPPDLLILDLHMPDPDGFEVLAQLKPWFEGRWFPVLVVTADVTVEARQRALSGGARDFLTKPFDMVEVLLRIKNLLEVRFLQLESRKQNLVLEQLVTTARATSTRRAWRRSAAWRSRPSTATTRRASTRSAWAARRRRSRRSWACVRSRCR